MGCKLGDKCRCVSEVKACPQWVLTVPALDDAAKTRLREAFAEPRPGGVFLGIDWASPIPHTVMPAPDTLVEYFNGEVAAAMFHYGGDDVAGVAASCGFEVSPFVRLSNDPDARDLDQAYADGATDVLARWHPRPPAGWSLGFKGDTEDGPVACFIRRKPD
jgi:hypothetical protein